MEKKRITVLPHQFNNNDYFLLKFNYDESLVSIARSMGCRWLVSEEGWAIYRSKENLHSLIRAFSGISIVDTSKIGYSTSVEDYENNFKNVPEAYSQVLIRKGFNDKAIRIYTSLFREFVNHFEQSPLKDISSEKIEEYIDSQISEKKIAGKTLEQLIQAINLYYHEVLKRVKIEVPLTRERNMMEKNPFSKKQSEKMLEVTKNAKHKAILSLLYNTDLERKQVIDLKKEDVDLKKMRIKCDEGTSTGQEKSTVYFDRKVRDALTKYLDLYDPDIWLFEGAKGKKYASSTVKSIARTAYFKAGLDEKIPKKKRDPESERNWGS